MEPSRKRGVESGDGGGDEDCNEDDTDARRKRRRDVTYDGAGKLAAGTVEQVCLSTACTVSESLS